MPNIPGSTKARQALQENQVAHNREELSLANYATVASWLIQAGFLTYDTLNKVDPKVWEAAIKRFQRFFGLRATGALTGPDLRIMAMPRCGVPDELSPSNPEHIQFLRMQEVAEQRLPSWRKKGLTYYIKSRVKGMQASEFDAVIAGAWNSWDKLCGVSISRTNTSRNADIIVDTGSGRGSNFDGPGRTLAWAYIPQGDDVQLLMRFDLDETWIVDPRMRGILLFNVAAHEFGHSLGLTHSKKKGALMAPTYNSAVAVPQQDDDIPRIVARYGAEVAPRPEDPPVVPTPGQYVIRVQGEVSVDGHRLVTV